MTTKGQMQKGEGRWGIIAKYHLFQPNRQVLSEGSKNLKLKQTRTQQVIYRLKYFCIIASSYRIHRREKAYMHLGFTLGPSPDGLRETFEAQGHTCLPNTTTSLLGQRQKERRDELAW